MTDRRSTVLVADDEPHLLRLVRFRLEREGYEVVTAADGQCAIDQIRRQVPDLCLLDVVMPRRSGWDVLQEVRADERSRALKVIMLTARATDVDIQTGMRLGADGYITKPFTPQDLRTRVAAHLPA
jgi:two-component system, OmpR family, alkaline phosphatase synthesis response regulator PhoP